MDKLLNAIASELYLRVAIAEKSEKVEKEILTVKMSWFNRKDVTEEVRELFKNELRAHIFNKLRECEVGEYVDYGFEHADVRPLGSIAEDVNDNLEEVLRKLPVPQKKEFYAFPSETYVRFTLVGKDGNDLEVESDIVSPWIVEACNKQ